MNKGLGFGHLAETVIKADLCCSCGTCVAACPEGIIRLEGEECRPTAARPSECTECSRCVAACPGRHVPYAQLLGQRPVAGSSVHFGPHLAKFRAAATDAQVRAQGASGGFVTAFLSFLLEAGEIDSAIVAGAAEDEPWRSVAKIVTTPQELLACAGSRYTLVATNAALSDAKGRCALVGLPCHVLGFRKLEQLAPTVSQRIALVIGLFCGVNLDPRATGHILGELGVTDRSEVVGYRSRSASYGSARGELRNGRILKYPEHDSYGFDVVRLAPLFHRTRCSLCFDNVNELADVSVGDATGGARKESCIVVRTSRALSLVRAAQKAGRVALSPVIPDMHRENVFKKKRRAFTLREWMRSQRLPTVDLDFGYDLSDYPWESEEYRNDMLLLRQLARTEIGRGIFASLPRNEFSCDLGRAYVGWKG